MCQSKYIVCQEKRHPLRLKRSDIQTLFGSSVRTEVLFFFIDNPGIETYCRDLERRFGRGRGQVNKELTTLAKIGFLDCEKRGVERWYRLNTNHELAKVEFTT